MRTEYGTIFTPAMGNEKNKEDVPQPTMWTPATKKLASFSAPRNAYEVLRTSTTARAGGK
jgi:hypothetical protein